MNNKSDSLNDFDKFIKYNKALVNYENYIKNEYKNPHNYNILFGYLINYQYFEDLKKSLNHSAFNLFGGTKNDDYLKIFNPNKPINLKKLKIKETLSSRHLINLLKNGNKYVIITEELWNALNENDSKVDYLINYKIDKDIVSIHFKNNEILYFKNAQKNVIELSQYEQAEQNTIKSNFDEIKKIYNDIKQYYNNIELKFIEEFKEEKKSSIENYKREGFLISKSWIDKWKKCTNYDEIKKKYNLKNNNEEKSACDDIIYHLEKNNLKYKDLENLEIFNYKTKEEFDSALENNNLVIINDEFRQSFKANNNNAYKVTFSIFNGKIYIINGSKNEKINYNIYENIIFSKENYNLLYLKHMIKYI